MTVQSEASMHDEGHKVRAKMCLIAARVNHSTHVEDDEVLGIPKVAAVFLSAGQGVYICHDLECITHLDTCFVI